MGAALRRFLVVALLVLCACGPRALPDPTPLPRASSLPSGRGPGSTVPLDVSIPRSCVRPGSTLELTIVTAKAASLEIVVAFPGRDSPPIEARVPERELGDGRYAWRRSIPKDLRPGAAVAAVLARKAGAIGTYTVPFDVEERC